MKFSNTAVNPVLRAVGLAMGVAAVALTLMGSVPQEANLIMLGIGLFAISVEAIRSQ